MLKNRIMKWMEENIEEKEINETCRMITLPIFDSARNYVDVYVHFHEGSENPYKLTDNGTTLSSYHGALNHFKLLASDVCELFRITRKHGVCLNQENRMTLEMDANDKDLSFKIFEMGLCIAEVSSFVNNREPQNVSFEITDVKTGEYPDLFRIARNEKWAKGLTPNSMEGFQLDEDGNLFLTDEYENSRLCPRDRFRILIHLNGRTIHSFVY